MVNCLVIIWREGCSNWILFNYDSCYCVSSVDLCCDCDNNVVVYFVFLIGVFYL